MTREETHMTLKNKAIAAGLAVIAAFGSQSVIEPTAQAAPGDNVVTFGDSFTANPDHLTNTLRKFEPLRNTPQVRNYPKTGGCLQAPDNWSRLLQNKPGIGTVKDWSCSGQTSRTMLGRIDRAIAAGDLNSRTTAVAMSIGINNFGPGGRADGVNILDRAAIHRAFVADMRAAARKIRAVAPHAKLLIPGMVAVSDARGNYCAVNVIPNAPGPIPLGILRDIERSNASMQAAAASAIGAQFIEMRGATVAKHSSCAPDAQRFVAGVIDTTTPHYHMMFHPSRNGSNYIADRVRASLR